LALAKSADAKQLHQLGHGPGGHAVEESQQECRIARAGLQVARANLELAKLNLSYNHITAPIGGYINGSSFDVGSLLKAEESALATIVCLDPVYVSITMEQGTWFELRKRVQRGEFKGSDVPVEVSVLAGDLKRRGYLEFIEDAAFNSEATTMRVRVPNSDSALLPSLAAQVRYEWRKLHSALLVPVNALQVVQGKPYVWTVSNDKVLQRRAVKLIGSAHEGNLFEIMQGLKPDEQVVCNPAGAPQLADGMRIEPKRAP